jgi:hypothetical protein
MRRIITDGRDHEALTLKRIGPLFPLFSLFCFFAPSSEKRAQNAPIRQLSLFRSFGPVPQDYDDDDDYYSKHGVWKNR